MPCIDQGTLCLERSRVLRVYEAVDDRCRGLRNIFFPHLKRLPLVLRVALCAVGGPIPSCPCLIFVACQRLGGGPHCSAVALQLLFQRPLSPLSTLV